MTHSASSCFHCKLGITRMGVTNKGQGSGREKTWHTNKTGLRESACLLLGAGDRFSLKMFMSIKEER